MSENQPKNIKNLEEIGKAASEKMFKDFRNFKHVVATPTIIIHVKE